MFCIRDSLAYNGSYTWSEFIVSSLCVREFSMCQIFSFHGNCTVRNGQTHKNLLYLSMLPNQSHTSVPLFFPPFPLTTQLSTASSLLIQLSIHLSLSLSLPVSLLFHPFSLYLCVSVASRHRAAVLTCACNTWASLLIRLRSTLKEIPSTYTCFHTDTHAETHTRIHTHVLTGRLQSPQGLDLVNYSVCVGRFV